MNFDLRSGIFDLHLILDEADVYHMTLLLQAFNT